MRSAVLVTSVICSLLFPSNLLLGDTVHVTHYVTKVQEERRSTRWTLTEWLRIKERMRMMDVWLAMFSSPQKDNFQPELNLEYGKTRGQSTWQQDGVDSGESESAGSEMRATLWLTNLITASTGFRTLNVDFGIGGFSKLGGGSYTLLDGTQAQTDITGESVDVAGTNHLQHYTGNLRIFGKSTQDTSIALKYGRFDLGNSLLADVNDIAAKKASGMARGADLSIYLTGFLGVEGSAMIFKGENLPAGLDELKGSYYNYSAFVEISLLRLLVGRYREDWSFKTYDTERTAREEGLLAGVKIQL